MEDIEREFYNKLAQGYEDDLVPDETFAVAFAKEERDQCCKDICFYCEGLKVFQSDKIPHS